ncbi:hypothetical protein LV779_07335 [Streptomyces thinghirensis]|nr:hypothetical protein [Streptomyces thinghirensis]
MISNRAPGSARSCAPASPTSRGRRCASYSRCGPWSAVDLARGATAWAYCAVAWVLLAVALALRVVAVRRRTSL